MKVSLCGPHSFDTSTLPLTMAEVVLSGAASPPLSRMNWYLLHQVGSCALVCPLTLAGRLERQRLNARTDRMPRTVKRYLFMTLSPFGENHSLLFDWLLSKRGDSIPNGPGVIVLVNAEVEFFSVSLCGLRMAKGLFVCEHDFDYGGFNDLSRRLLLNGEAEPRR